MLAESVRLQVQFGLSPPTRRWDGLFAEAAQQFGIHLLRMSPGYAVWAALHDHQSRTFDEFGCALSRSGDRDNPVIVTVNHKCGYIDAGHIFAEVLMPSWNACQAGCC